MKPDISEFSYGYALTSEIVKLCGTTLVGAPVFPSLIDEGSLGYDLELPIAGAPVFLQFKLSDYMVRATALGADKVSVPHYRMHLRPLKHSQQHDLLLDLENKGRKVFYAAPEFHTPNELNDAYAKKEIIWRSAFFRPKAIGTLPDKDEHFVCFKLGSSNGFFCSEPVQVERVPVQTVFELLSNPVVDATATQVPARVYLMRLADELVSEWAVRSSEAREEAGVSTTGGEVYSEDRPGTLAGSDREAEQERLKVLAEIRHATGPREYVGWVAQTLFDCAVFVRLRLKAGNVAA